MADDMLSDIKERLGNTPIYNLRQIARAVGVHCPTVGKKPELIDKILAIASCRIAPAPRSARGAPPKSEEYDEAIVKDIFECKKYYAMLATGSAENVLEVSDGTKDAGCAGILVKGEKNCFLRVNGCLASADDVYVPESYITRFHLREGDFVTGECKRKAEGIAGLTKILSVNGYSPDSVPRREYARLTPVYPQNRISIGISQHDIAARMIDMFAPLGMGQRAVISAPANSGKITLLKQIATAISLNEQNFSVIIFIVAGSPEEITDISRSAGEAEVFYTTFAMESGQHAEAAHFVTAYCKSAAESGENVVLIVDGLSKLGPAAKPLLSSAICAEEGGSFTVIATVSGEGEYSSEYSKELISMANMQVALSDEHSAEIDIAKSYTLNCELLQGENELKTADMLRQLAKSGDINAVIQKFRQTQSNTEIK